MNTFISAHAKQRGSKLLLALIFAFASFAGMTLISLLGAWLLD